MTERYLDNSATTRPCPEAVGAALEAMERYWGNPSSIYASGIAAADVVDSSRASVARVLGADKDEIYFSSSGTLCSNTALFGAMSVNRGVGARAVTTSVEHPCASRVFDRLERDGCDVYRLRCKADGSFDPDELAQAVDGRTALVSVMAVNNEIGTVFDVARAARIIKAKNPKTLFHVDAVQAMGKLPLSVKKIGCDLMTVSAHKIHGIKGAGALFVKKGVRLPAYVLGGGQERNLFSGTEPVPAIAAFGAAADALPDIAVESAKVSSLRDRLLAGLKHVDRAVVNSPADALPHVVNFSLPGLPSEVAVNALSAEGIFVSSGSACHRGRRSEVLSAIGLPPERIDSAIRVSFSRYNDATDVDALLDAVSLAVKRFAKK